MSDYKLPRRSPEIGLPTQPDLVGLAKKWLEDQRKHWPDHPDPRLRDQRDDDTVAAEMASQFRDGYLRGAGLSFSTAKKSGGGLGARPALQLQQQQSPLVGPATG